MFEIFKNLENLLIESLKDSIKDNDNFGIVLSGGIDSSVLAFLSKKCNYNFINYTVGTYDSDDVKFVKKLKDENLGLNFKIIEINEEDIKENLEILLKILKENKIEINKLNVSTAIPIYFISKSAKEDSINLLLSGQGGDEIFGGYHRYLRMNKEEREKNMQRDVKNTYIDNLNREIFIANYFGIKIKYPYLNEKFLGYALSIPIDIKIFEVKEKNVEEEFKECIDEINGKKFIKKYILRKFAQYIGIPESIVKRKKKAMQYGSKSEKMLKGLIEFENKI